MHGGVRSLGRGKRRGEREYKHTIISRNIKRESTGGNLALVCIICPRTLLVENRNQLSCETPQSQPHQNGGSSALGPEKSAGWQCQSSR